MRRARRAVRSSPEQFTRETRDTLRRSRGVNAERFAWTGARASLRVAPSSPPPLLRLCRDDKQGGPLCQGEQLVNQPIPSLGGRETLYYWSGGKIDVVESRGIGAQQVVANRVRETFQLFAQFIERARIKTVEVRIIGAP